VVCSALSRVRVIAAQHTQQVNMKTGGECRARGRRKNKKLLKSRPFSFLEKLKKRPSLAHGFSLFEHGEEGTSF